MAGAGYVLVAGAGYVLVTGAGCMYPHSMYVVVVDSRGMYIRMYVCGGGKPGGGGCIVCTYVMVADREGGCPMVCTHVCGGGRYWG